MTADEERNHGGDAPCFAHILDRPQPVTDAELAGLVRDMADAVVVADAEGTVTFWNSGATRLFGYTADEAVGESLDLIIPERLRERHWTGYRHTMATGNTRYGDRLLEVPARHRDGRTLSVAFTVTLRRRPGADAPYAIAAVLRDDTERWRERKQLRDKIAALRASLGPTSDIDVPSGAAGEV